MGLMMSKDTAWGVSWKSRYLLPGQHSRANKPRVHVTLGLAFSALLSGLQHAKLRVNDFRLPRVVE